MALLFLRATPNPTCVTCDVRMDVTFVGRSYRMHTTLVGYSYIILLASSGMYAYTSRIVLYLPRAWAGELSTSPHRRPPRTARTGLYLLVCIVREYINNVRPCTTTPIVTWAPCSFAAPRPQIPNAMHTTLVASTTSTVYPFFPHAPRLPIRIIIGKRANNENRQPPPSPFLLSFSSGDAPPRTEKSDWP